MKRTIQVAMMIVLGLALVAAAYTPPTAEQLNAAAAGPADNLAALLQDASVNEAAAVAKEVAELVAGLGLSAEEQAGRLAQVVQILFARFPSAQHEALAAAWGDALAGSSALPASALAAIRDAVSAADGASDGAGALLLAYDQALLTGGGTLPPAPNPEPPDSNETPPPPDPEPSDPDPSGSEPPPPPPDYPGQNIL
jgi:hypothetical protein